RLISAHRGNRSEVSSFSSSTFLLQLFRIRDDTPLRCLLVQELSAHWNYEKRKEKYFLLVSGSEAYLLPARPKQPLSKSAGRRTKARSPSGVARSGASRQHPPVVPD
ncbi:hypothetical protein CH063_14853, partial [Colletotrichum higginsianum]